MWSARVILCAMAICLLWLSNLHIAKSIVHAFLGRASAGDAAQSVQDTVCVLDEESVGYERCMGNRLETCKESTQVLFQEGESGLEELRQGNDKRLMWLDSLVRSCEIETFHAFFILTELQAQGQVELVDIMKADRMKLPECRGLGEISQREAAARQSLAIASEFQETSNARMDSMAVAMEKRAKYDEEYLHKKRSYAASLAEEIRAQTTSVHTTLDKLATIQSTTDEMVTKAFGRMHDTKIWAQAKYSALWNAYVDALDRARVFQERMRSFYDDVQSFLRNKGVKMVLRFINAPSVDFDRVVHDLLYTHAKNEFESSAYKHQLDQQITAIQADAEFVREQSRRESKQATTNQRSETSSHQENEQGNLERMFSDYNPPDDVAPREQARAFDNDMGVFINELSSTMDGVGSVSRPLGAHAPNASAGEAFWNDLAEADTSSSTIESLQSKQWDLFFYEGVTMKDFIANVGSLDDLTTHADIAFRIMSTLHIINKYLRLSKVVTPPVDLRENAQVKRDGAITSRDKPKMTPHQRVAFVVLHPATSAIASLLFLWLFLSAFMAMYFPVFEKFSSACVQFDAPHTLTDLQDTFLSANALTLAEQYASQGGERVASKGIDVLNAENRAFCKNITSFYKSLSATQAHQHSQLVARAASARKDMQSLESCIDLNKTGLAFKTLVAQSTCQRIPIQPLRLDLLHFNCSSVPACILDCERPNHELLRFWTWTSACKVEAYVHTSVFSSIFGAIIYVLLNIARILAVRGLRYFMWDSLSSDRFSFIATARTNHESNHCSDLHSDARAMAQGLLSKYRKKGLLLMLLSVLVLIPGIVMLFQVSQKLKL